MCVAIMKRGLCCGQLRPRCGVDGVVWCGVLRPLVGERARFADSGIAVIARTLGEIAAISCLRQYLPYRQNIPWGVLI